MITIPMKSRSALNRDTLLSINTTTSGDIQSMQTVSQTHADASPCSNPARAAQRSLQQQRPAQRQRPTPQQTPAAQHMQQQRPLQMQVPPLAKPVQKGQKVSLETAAPISSIRACFGWNTDNPKCDVDVSAFLLGADGKVLGDSWFVFYGQTKSPDSSTEFRAEDNTDREIITIDFRKINPKVHKIVFVLTINEAFEQKLHFGMMKDAYIRILNAKNQCELVSFQMTDYYSNVISMMIGEIYQHNETWKFNAIGNGVARDLLGLCTLYGVQVQE